MAVVPEAQVYETKLGPLEAAVAGSGPAVVLVHGTGGSWRQVIPLAEDLSNDYTVVLVSRPGYGRSPLRSGPTHEDQAAAYAAILDTLGLARASILGISGGGPSTVLFAARYRERCSGLVLCSALAPQLASTRGMWAAEIPGTVRIWMVVESRRRNAAIKDPQARERYLRAYLTKDEQMRVVNDTRLAADLLAFLLHTADAPSAEAGTRSDIASIRRAHRAGRQPDKDIGVPALVLHGESDTIVPATHGRYHATVIPGASLELYAKAGHLLLLTYRRETSARIQTFLAGLPVVGPPTHE